MNERYDVAVIGAGPSGIAAALYAAKYGAKTVLLEKSSVIGGTAIKAYVHTLKGTSLSGMDGMLSGITKKAWGNIIFQPEELIDRYYAMLSTQPVELVSGCEVISAETEGGKVTSVVCAGKEGKQTVSAKVFIDASGVQLLDAMTGAKDMQKQISCYMTGLIGKVETVGGRCYSHEAKSLLHEKTELAKEHGTLSRDFSFSIYPTVRADIALIAVRSDVASIDGVKMRSFLNRAVEFVQDFGYGFENASLISASKEVFCIPRGNFSAKYTLKAQDVEENTFFSDHIAALPDDDGEGERLYYIPMGSIISSRFDNLLLCGVNIGAAANAMELIDSIPTHFETGKAAGITATIAVKNSMRPEGVSSYEVISKSEDSVSDKIEILNETYKDEDDSSAIETTFNIEQDDEDESITPSFKSAFASKEKYKAENFDELEHALSLIGKDGTAEKEGAKDLDPDLSMMLNIDPDEIVKKEEKTPDIEETMDELSSIIQSLNTASDIMPDKPAIEPDLELAAKKTMETEPVPEPDKEANAPEPHRDNAVYNILSDILSEHEEPISESVTTPEKKESANDMLGTGAFVLPELMEIEPSKEPEHTSEDIVFDIVLPENIPTVKEEEPSSEPLKEEEILNGMMLGFEPKKEEVEEAPIQNVTEPDVPEQEEVEAVQEQPEENVVADTPEPKNIPRHANVVDSGYDSFFGEDIPQPPNSKKESAFDFSKPAIEPEASKEKETEKQKNTSLVSNDVLSLLYDETDVEDDSEKEDENNMNGPAEQDDTASAEHIAEPPLEPVLESKSEEPESQEKDKVSSMLDMIYDITESQTEEPEEEVEDDFSDLEAMIPSPSVQNGTDKAWQQSKFANTEKFKAIKDILYDNDNN